MRLQLCLTFTLVTIIMCLYTGMDSFVNKICDFSIEWQNQTEMEQSGQRLFQILLIQLRAVYNLEYKQSRGDSVYGCRSDTAALTAQPYTQGIVFPDMTLIDSGVSQICSWVISSQNVHDVISFQVTDWFGPASYSCVRDYVVIRDGASPLSPSLRVVCGETHFKGTVTSTSSSIYVQFHVFVNDGQRGFALEYWSVQSSPVMSLTPVYGTANYVLIIVTVIVTLAFVGGLVYLAYREKYREKKVLEGQMRQLLQRRRKGISGISGAEDSLEDHNEDFETSRTDVTSFVETPSPVSSNWRV